MKTNNKDATANAEFLLQEIKGCAAEYFVIEGIIRLTELADKFGANHLPVDWYKLYSRQREIQHDALLSYKDKH